MKNNLTPTVEALIGWEPEGYRFFLSWCQQLKRPNGKSHSNATSVLTHIVYHLTRNYTDFAGLYTTPFDPHTIGIVEMQSLSHRQVRDGVLFLDGRGILCPQDGVSSDEAVRILREKSPQALDRGFCHCPWCGCSTMKLQAHHYPIAAKDGGSEVVMICANCHFEYHALVDGYGYVLDADEFERITYEIDRGEG